MGDRRGTTFFNKSPLRRIFVLPIFLGVLSFCIFIFAYLVSGYLTCGPVRAISQCFIKLSQPENAKVSIEIVLKAAVIGIEVVIGLMGVMILFEIISRIRSKLGLTDDGETE